MFIEHVPVAVLTGEDDLEAVVLVVDHDRDSFTGNQMRVELTFFNGEVRAYFTWLGAWSRADGRLEEGRGGTPLEALNRGLARKRLRFHSEHLIDIHLTDAAVVGLRVWLDLVLERGL